MSVSSDQKVDLLYKQAFGVTKTDTATNKGPSNEAIASPLLLRGDTIWIESSLIPIPASTLEGVVQEYSLSSSTTAVEMTPDITTVPVGGVYPTWLTNLTNWIPSEFDPSYLIKVYIDDPGSLYPESTGVQIYAAGSGGTGEYYFNHVSGVLNFIGGTIPAGLTSGKSLYIVGYRYIGSLGFSSNISLNNAVVTGNLEIRSPTTVMTGNVNVGGNIVAAGNVTTPNLISTTVTTGTIQANTWVGIYTANVKETSGNLYYTNARVDARVNPKLTTANVVELNNLYYTDTRVQNYIGPIVDLKANVVDLATANVYESEGNLYYTNDRVAAFVTPNLDLKANVVDLTTANVIELNNLYYTDSRVSAYVTPRLATKANVKDLTTANVKESASNLYYTNARVQSYLLQAQNIIPAAGGTYDLGSETNPWRDLWLSGFTIRLGNLKLSDNNGTLAVTVGNTNAPGLVTSSVAENGNTDVGNVYFTNARARAVVSGGTGVVYDEQTGLISIGQNVAPTATVTFANLFVSGTTTFYGNVTTYAANNLTVGDNMLYLNANAEAGNPDIGFTAGYNDGSYHHTGFFRDATDGRYKVFYNYTPEPDANIFIDTSHASFKLANLQADILFANVQGEVTGNLTGNVTGYVSTISNFTTDDLTEGSSLYYTNARVDAHVVPQLTTANVVETDNLYYTNARVTAHIQADLDSKANVVDLTTSNVAELDNLYYTNDRVYSNVIELLPEYNGNINAVAITSTIWNNLYTANVLESDVNLYYTNARVLAYVTPYLTSGNITETSETLFYTNDRVAAFVTPNLDLKANVVDLTTANVAELPSALYYTNARVAAFVTPNLDLKANVVDMTTSNVAERSDALYYTNARVAAFVTPNLNLKANVVDMTTSNVAERENLYYTNARVAAFVTPNLDLKANVVDLTTANVAESATALYYTNARVDAHVVPQLTTANVVELNNLYFTNARVLDAVAYQNFTFGTLTLTNDLILLGNNFIVESTTVTVKDKNIVIAANAINAAAADGAGITIDGANANITYDALGDKFDINKEVHINGAEVLTLGITTSAIPEGSNLYYTNARVYSNVIPLLNLKANVVDMTTANVAELNNLYYTNSRVDTYVTGTTLSNITIAGNVVAGNIIADAVYGDGSMLTGVTATGYSGDTDAITEGTINLFYTNARVAAFVTPNLDLKANVVDLTTANVAERSSALYYTNARVASFVTPNLNLKANVVDMTTSNVAERSDALYYTNARVAAFVTPNLNLKANVVDLTTANVAERSGALYYTNARVAAFVTPNLDLKANVVDLTTSNVAEGTNLYFTNSRVIDAVTNQNLILNDLKLLGNFIVEGNTVVLNTSTVTVEDKNILLANGAVSANVADGAGISIAGANANIVYRETGDKFEINKPINVATSVTTTNVYADNITAANISFTTLVGINTANVAELNNLYYTNARVYSNTVALLPEYEGNIKAGNVSVQGAVSYTNTSKVIKVYQVYNSITNSLDTVFV